MKTALEYLEEAEEKLGTCSNASATARALKTTPQAIHNYKSGVSKMDDYHCIRVAQVLGIDPMEIIAAAQEEREKNEEKREFWRDFRRARTREDGHASVQVMIAMAMTGMIALLSAKWPELTAIYIMSNLVRAICKQTMRLLVTRFMSLLRNTQQKLTQVSYLASVSAS
ncbi:hypothetical protein AA0N74_02505 [Chromobacterium vaccinii]|uniref:hypothetical protein n=1 Tax=Chromobacterium vaccinii TaxID=1108595 RepID=UPI0031D99EF5